MVKSKAMRDLESGKPVEVSRLLLSLNKKQLVNMVGCLMINKKYSIIKVKQKNHDRS